MDKQQQVIVDPKITTKPKEHQVTIKQNIVDDQKNTNLDQLRDDNIGLPGVIYTNTELSNEYQIIKIPKYDELFKPSDPHHPFFGYFNKDFSKARYKYGGYLPLHIGTFQIDKSQHTKNVLRCPIKTANTNELIVPSELSYLHDFIKFCCIYESSFNDEFDQLYAHITVDKKLIQPNMTHRVPGFHVDGFQGHKFPLKHKIEHSYLWSSDVGTEFCCQPFFIEHIDESKFLIFEEFDKQAIENNVYKCLPHNIYIFDPYMVHRSPKVTEETDRLLIRITFEYDKLLDPNDTVNPNLKFNVPYKYDVRNRLGQFDFPYNINHYGWNRGTACPPCPLRQEQSPCTQ